MAQQLAVVTGASSGIGYELAKCCLENGYDVVIASDTTEIEQAASQLRVGASGSVQAVQADLSTREGVETLYQAVRVGGRPVDALLANAGRGLGRGFLQQDFDEVQRVIDTNIVGTLYLLQRFVNDMVTTGKGQVLITGSIAGLMPGTFQAVYNGTKAFIDSFSYALRHEIKDSGVTVTCLMPGPTDTDFFETADMLDTKVGSDKKADPAGVAKEGFNAMRKGEGHVVAGIGNKVQAAMASVTPQGMLAEMHRGMAEPGTAKP